MVAHVKQKGGKAPRQSGKAAAQPPAQAAEAARPGSSTIPHRAPPTDRPVRVYADGEWQLPGGAERAGSRDAGDRFLFARSKGPEAPSALPTPQASSICSTLGTRGRWSRPRRGSTAAACRCLQSPRLYAACLAHGTESMLQCRC